MTSSKPLHAESGIGESQVPHTINGVANEADTDLSKDDVFHLLQNERRRQVLRYLRGVDEPVEMRDVAEQVAAWEHDTTVRQLTSTQRQRVYIALYQSHLPKLDDHGVIRYNQPRGIVEPTPLADEIAGYLEPDSVDDQTDDVEHELPPWIPSFAGASIVATGVTATTWAGLFPATVLSGPLLLTAVTAIFVVLTAVLTAWTLDAERD